jgi:hypothetical protein
MLECDYELIGTNSILWHADDVEAADEVAAWRNATENKDFSKPGDDRSPPWTWHSYLYHDGKHLAVPQANIMTALRTAGAKMRLKGTQTFKSLSQTGLLITSDFCRFESNGGQINVSDIVAMRNLSFSEQKAAVRRLGFDLYVKRAKLPSSKNIRVRAKFEDWRVTGTIIANEPAITFEVLAEMFRLSGRYAGLMDWRPSSPKSSGPHGTYDAILRMHDAKARKPA